tara:strand:- start:24 stop:1241 length:1218 start_codon:yes stop_codon:yes gene_type:complete
MAFNMKRPIIKGTPLHKASIAKAAEKSIVSQSRTQADSGLIAAANAMGKADVPAAIDFSIDQTIDGIGDARGGRKKKEKEETDEQKAAAAEKLRKKNLQEEYAREHPNGTLIDGKYYDVNGKEIKQKKVKEEKTPTDNMFNDVDDDGNVVSRLFGRARQAAKKKQADNKAKWEAEQKEKEKLNAEKLKVKTAQEKEQAKIDAENQAKIDAEKLKKDKHKAKVKELKGYQKEKDAADKEAQRLKDIQMNKKENIIIEPPVADAIGGKQINQYTKEQRDRLKTEGVWSDEAEKMVLPEEIVDGEFVSQAEGTKLEVLESDNFSGDNQTNQEVVEEEKVPKASSGKQKRLDRKYKLAGPSVRANMEADGYVPPESKSPMEMRDDRVYKFARKDGPVRENMIKGGYKPQ